MKIINYKSIEELKKAADLNNMCVMESPTSYSFRIFGYDNKRFTGAKKCTELHILNKK